MGEVKYSGSSPLYPEIKASLTKIEPSKFLSKIRGKSKKVIEFQRDNEVHHIAYRSLPKAESQKGIFHFRNRSWVKLTVEDHGSLREVKVKVKDLEKLFNIQGDDLQRLKDLAKRNENVSEFLKRHFIAHQDEPSSKPFVKNDTEKFVREAKELEHTSNTLNLELIDHWMGMLDQKRSAIISENENLTQRANELRGRAEALMREGEDISHGPENLRMDALSIQEQVKRETNESKREELIAEIQEIENKAKALEDRKYKAETLYSRGVQLYEKINELAEASKPDEKKMESLRIKAEALQNQATALDPKSENLYFQADEFHHQADEISKKIEENEGALKDLESAAADLIEKKKELQNVGSDLKTQTE